MRRIRITRLPGESEPTITTSGMKPTVPEVLPLVHALYATAHGAVGGCLHIVLDDGNVETGHVKFALAYARENGCADCTALGEKLLQMSTTQRAKLSARAYEGKKR